ncbi:MAG: hypothetical protein JETT_0578 [Candidatus Jettenia ecosi]|uniref:Uncharacterized protein n=1 Tax=Candidatus Jettenia ecosi TaxID=2494326 RepID=A0A533QEF2_9BACT|nr:MAG: hypothetical protein JETT_0578 [Candidatus Jettenia ecosi]
METGTVLLGFLPTEEYCTFIRVGEEEVVRRMTGDGLGIPKFIDKRLHFLGSSISLVVRHHTQYEK